MTYWYGRYINKRPAVPPPSSELHKQKKGKKPSGRIRAILARRKAAEAARVRVQPKGVTRGTVLPNRRKE